jgi:tRNA (guanine37-N1)-methyltransferase
MTNKKVPWQAVVLTIFPEMFPGPLGCSLSGQALKNSLWALHLINLRDFTKGMHKSVDDPPFGGGPGMLMRPDVIDDAIKYTDIKFSSLPLIFLTPRGKKITQSKIKKMANGPGIRVLCGRYEGIDQRVIDANEIEEINLADFILSGGEPAAITILDACIRLLPGVIGERESLFEESFENNLLEYPQFTRPQNWRGIEVPSILLSGNHHKIKKWRLDQAQEITKNHRPDLWEEYSRVNQKQAIKYHG